MYKRLLFYSFHAATMNKATGVTPDPFLCLHTESDPGQPEESHNPFASFANVWRKHHQSVLTPRAMQARQGFHARQEWPSLWETQEVQQRLMALAKVGAFSDDKLSFE